ncbi:MAG: transposase family protein [Methanobacterium sp.]
MPRPKDKQKRKDYYSGKKKKHAIKTQITNNKKGLIVHIRKLEGKKHDYKLFKEQPPPIPKNIGRIHDSGYHGIKKDFPELKVRIPYKKPKGGELTETQKEYNKELRRERVVSEHTIGKMKKYEIMGSKFRNSPERYDTHHNRRIRKLTMDSDDITLNTKVKNFREK